MINTCILGKTIDSLQGVQENKNYYCSKKRRMRTF